MICSPFIVYSYMHICLQILVCNTQFDLGYIKPNVFTCKGCFTKSLYNMIHFSHFQHRTSSYKPEATDTQDMVTLKSLPFVFLPHFFLLRNTPH